MPTDVSTQIAPTIATDIGARPGERGRLRCFRGRCVHRDGLVHVSQLADRFVKDPHEVVKAGDVVKVRVVEVDIPRKRIGLSMRREGGTAGDRTPKGEVGQGRGGRVERNAQRSGQKKEETGSL